MTKLTGIPVSPGIAIGSAFVLYREKLNITNKYIAQEAVPQELARFQKAIADEVTEAEKVIEQYANDRKEKDLLTSQIMILQDPLLNEKITALIENKLISAEFSLHIFLRETKAAFAKMSNSYFSERISDYKEIVMRLINRLRGNNHNLIDEVPDNGKPLILIVEDISPSDVAKSYHRNIAGICLSKGSKTSHSAIIARALGMPVIVGISDLFDKIEEGKKIIMDGSAGLLLIDPDTESGERYLQEQLKEDDDKKDLEKLIDVPCRTADGKSFQLLCNIELEEELETVLKINADGIGLFRTEYLFIDRATLPSEEEQYKIYRSIAAKMAGKQVIIRTYDLGGDKLAASLNTEKENNPFLGCRGIRLSLKHPDIFKTQLRAILRANETGNIAVMFPMVSSASEVIAAKKIVRKCSEELHSEKIPHNSDILIGAMIEIPAAVFSIRELAGHCDFFSIGTNDLVQYTLAADRDNKQVANYYNPNHPAVLKMLAITVANARRFGKPVSVCGEIASDTDFIPVLVGLGVDSLSVNPAVLLKVKKSISTVVHKEAQKMVRSKISS